MAELLECKGIVHSLHGGPLIVLLAQHIDLVTMPNELFIFYLATFDETCAAATVLTPIACSRPLAATRAFRFPDPWSHPAAVRHPMRHSVPLRMRSGSL
jgi:hypothetical protein